MYGWALLHFVLCVSTFHFHSDLYPKWLVLIHLFFSASGPEKVSFEQGGVLLTGKLHLCLWLQLFCVCVRSCFREVFPWGCSVHRAAVSSPFMTCWAQCPGRCSDQKSSRWSHVALGPWGQPQGGADTELLLTWARCCVQPSPWAAAQRACSMGTPADFSEPTWKCGLAFLWSPSSGLYCLLMLQSPTCPWTSNTFPFLIWLFHVL